MIRKAILKRLYKIQKKNEEKESTYAGTHSMTGMYRSAVVQILTLFFEIIEEIK
jgi:hypothetical protein